MRYRATVVSKHLPHVKFTTSSFALVENSGKSYNGAISTVPEINYGSIRCEYCSVILPLAYAFKFLIVKYLL